MVLGMFIIRSENLMFAVAGVLEYIKRDIKID